MPKQSRLARLQQVTTLGLLAIAIGWFAWHWRASPMTAIAGFLLIAMSYAIFLAIEFVALYFVGSDGTERPSAGELLRAWAGEVVSAPRVFCWRQPFRWRAIADSDKVTAEPCRSVVFIHGFVCNRGFWNPWLARMQDAGVPFAAVNLEPVFGSIEAYAPIIEEALTRMTAAGGLPPVLVCHSMGGLAARAWLRAPGAAARVHRVVTIGSPHRGTWLGRFSHLTNGRQMRLDGEWIRALTGVDGAGPYSNFTCWYSNCDNIVFPVKTATLPGADNRLVRGIAHVDLAFHHEVMDATIGLICSP